MKKEYLISADPLNPYMILLKKNNHNVKKKYLKKEKKINIPINASMNLKKLKKLIR